MSASGLTLEKVNPAAWREWSHNAHKIAFSELNNPLKERIDYALLLIDAEKPVGYVTCRELDADTVYWQFGGAFPGTRGSVNAFRGYQMFVEHARANYARVCTLIENTNLPMLKMAMKVGFRVIGIRTFKGSILLEHLLEFSA